MTTEAAGATDVVAVPRLAVERLVELRGFLDRIARARPFGDHNIGGYADDKTIKIEAI